MSLPLNVSKGDIVACCNENFFNAEIGPFCTREEQDGSMRLEEQLPKKRSLPRETLRKVEVKLA